MRRLGRDPNRMGRIDAGQLYLRRHDLDREPKGGQYQENARNASVGVPGLGRARSSN
jgi:hypothetical protein